MRLSDLKSQHVTELVEMASSMGIEGANRLRKHDLIFTLLKTHAKRGESIYGDGVLEVLPDGFGFLRSPEASYLAGTDDLYISPSQIRRFNLHTGDTVEGEIRTPKDGERYFALVKVDKINGEAPETAKNKILLKWEQQITDTTWRQEKQFLLYITLHQRHTKDHSRSKL